MTGGAIRAALLAVLLGCDDVLLVDDQGTRINCACADKDGNLSVDSVCAQEIPADYCDAPGNHEAACRALCAFTEKVPVGRNNLGAERCEPCQTLPGGG